MSIKHFLKGCVAILPLLVFAFCTPEASTFDEPFSEKLRLNQIGFYPNSSKVAVILSEDPEDKNFYVLDAESNEVVHEGDLKEAEKKTLSEKVSWIADFSGFEVAGKYKLGVPGIGSSYAFTIEENVHADLAKASLRAFYYQRMSTELLPEHAGKWARPSAHPDDQVMVHPSAASPKRPEGTVISAPYGWYDAGDYNKYIVNSGITMGTLMSLFEDFGNFAGGLDLEIPESGDSNPDILDEIYWNLKWMLEMQDPEDGGVYHKLTTASFEGRVMPHEATSQRYVVAKSTGAALNFAAVMAQAYRVFSTYDQALSERCLEASKDAWRWAKKNPNILYRQNEMNQRFDPDVTTGAYGDSSVEDEFVWAASELWVSTQDESYLEDVSTEVSSFSLPNWNTVNWLGYYTLFRHERAGNRIPLENFDAVKALFMETMDDYIKSAQESAYHVVMGQDVKDFVWGSNSVAANQGIALIQAYLLSERDEYVQYALHNLDYILGRNATGFSYVTGHGSKTPMDPHHRPSGAEPDKEPIPGLIVGGPNPGQQDDCEYESEVPDESFVDDYCSYASNEIAINWSAPFAYLVVALEAIHN
ncbi:glycoside hydrolase family 9 protein [Pleomorphovibrio marinus]|uniref:glycoside hydrolase family 9 protein n=1 Tax=Pleomorphovibrio marinus TaxID=2164132 RepID=UPI000E0ADD71|nr:glycoside hydrolase family 9 protein [Pleomorphovibrio marinus]